MGTCGMVVGASADTATAESSSLLLSFSGSSSLKVKSLQIISKQQKTNKILYEDLWMHTAKKVILHYSRFSLACFKTKFDSRTK